MADRSLHSRSRALLLLALFLAYCMCVQLAATRVALLAVSAEWFAVAFQVLRTALVLAGAWILTRFAAMPEDGIPSTYPAERRWLGGAWDADADAGAAGAGDWADAPVRFGSGAEFAQGIAVGWGIAVALVVPMALDGGLRIYSDFSPPALARLGLIVLATACAAVFRQTALTGFGLRRLQIAFGPGMAALLTAVFAMLLQSADVRGSWPALLTIALFQAACCLAALRTGSLWLAFGMDFFSRFFLGAVFGLPVLGSSQYSSVILSGSQAPAWLGGGQLGPAAGVTAPLFLLVAILVVLRLTRVDVIANIRPGGIPMQIASPHAPAFPAAGSGIGAAPPAGTTLVQIGAQSPADVPAAKAAPLPERPD